MFSILNTNLDRRTRKETIKSGKGVRWGGDSVVAKFSEIAFILNTIYTTYNTYNMKQNGKKISCNIK